jgi:hypothetical protein
MLMAYKYDNVVVLTEWEPEWDPQLDWTLHRGEKYYHCQKSNPNSTAVKIKQILMHKHEESGFNKTSKNMTKLTTEQVMRPNL